ncbi:MAG: thioredoxin family protein [Desulfobaccales bacterium]
MKLLRGTLVGLFCLVVGFLLVWQAMPTQAQGSAAAKGKPALFEFGSKYCIPCKEMKEVMAALKTSHGDQVEFRMIYVDEEKPMFGEYKIVAIPTQVFLNPEGKEVDRHLGALSKEEVLKKLQELKFIR